MNNYGNISLKNSSQVANNVKNPISATANSTIKIKDRNSDLQNNYILTEASAPNASVAAARATAKAVSMATSNITNNANYLSNVDSSLTIQISTLCTIQRTKSDAVGTDLINTRHVDLKPQTDTVKRLNDRMYTNREIENVNLSKNKPTNKGTKFEKLKRELESLEVDRDFIRHNNINRSIINNYRSSTLSDHSVQSYTSMASSLQSEQPVSRLASSEPLNYCSDDSMGFFQENDSSRYRFQRNIGQDQDGESIDNNSHVKKYRISDLKRHSRIYSSNSPLKINSNNSSNSVEVDFENRDVNSFHCIKTVPGISCLKSIAVTGDFGALMSNSSLLPETDIDSGTINEKYFFPQTDFNGDKSSYSFEKTRSLVDLRKNSDIEYKDSVSKAISTEDLKKSKPIEECNLIKHLKSRAQSTQELRIADSLTKLNVPHWMNDFKLFHNSRQDPNPVRLPFSANLSYKNIKHHDNILSKHKYNSLPMTKNIIPKKEQPTNKIVLPSSLYRSKSQNLVYFNPKEDSKLKSAKNNQVLVQNSEINVQNLKIENEVPTVKVSRFQLSVEKDSKTANISKSNSITTTKSEPIVNRFEQTYKNLIPVSSKDLNCHKFEDQDDIIQQSKQESEFILITLIRATQNQTVYSEELCECFGINPSALKLLLNVKRKTPNLNRDETSIGGLQNENIHIENIMKKNENNNNCVICNFKNCNREILQFNKIDRGNCSCYNCFTYYCSKKCRNYDFPSHFAMCSFNRINRMLIKVKNSLTELQLTAVSKCALENYFKRGEGTVLIAFESCRAADDFLNGQLNRLISQPHYLTKRDIMKNMPTFKIMEYDCQKECVVTLVISATLPMTSIEQSYPTFRYSFKSRFVNLDFKNIVLENLLIQQEKQTLETFENRKKFYDYVINFFRLKNINLKQSHPVLFNKLDKYLNDGLQFESLTVLIKDPILNTTIACTVNIQKEIVTKVIRNISNKANANVSNNSNNSNNNNNTNNNVNKIITETEI